MSDASSTPDLYHLADAVRSKESFLALALALAADYREDARLAREHPPTEWTDRGPLGWTHDTIDGFLDALARWGEDASAATGEPWVRDEPDWRAFARILHAGKFYE